MELLNELQGVLQVISTYPGEFFVGSFITCPTDIVADGNSTTPIRFGVKDFTDFKFEFSLHFNRRRRFGNSVGNILRWYVGFDLGYWKDWVDPS